MKKKFGSLFLAVTLLANLAVPAMATSGPNSSPEIITKVTASNEIEVITDNYVTGGYLFEIGMPELRPLENINYPVIKITTLKMSSYANQKADAENPGASAGQKANIMTESALTYAKNSTVNNVATRYYNADGTGEFIDEYQMGLADRMVYNAKQKICRRLCAGDLSDRHARHDQRRLFHLAVRDLLCDGQHLRRRARGSGAEPFRRGVPRQELFVF